MQLSVKELNIEEPVCDHAENRGWLVRKLSWIGRRGGPDRLFAKGGRIVMVEFKRPKKGAEALQEREHNRLRRAGVEVHVIDSVEAGCALFD